MGELGEGQRDLDLVEKLGCIVGSPIGFLPPRRQMDIMKNDDGLGFERAAFASTVSRIEGIALSAAAVVGWGLKAFGVEVDHAWYNATLAGGAVLAVDTALREISLGIRYAVMGGNSWMRYGRPWGSAILSWIDAARHPEWYRHHNLDFRFEGTQD